MKPSALLRRSLVLLACLLPAAAGATERVLHAPENSLLAAELLGVEPLPGTDLALIALAVAGKQLSMFTGLNEAAAILRAQSNQRPERPQTHELLESALRSAGWQVKRVVVDRLDASGNFHAAIELVDEAGEIRWLDCRPSDGIALALRAAARLYVAETVLKSAGGPEPAAPQIST